MVLFDLMATAGLRGEASQVWSSGAGFKTQLSHLGARGPQPPKPGKPQGLPLFNGEKWFMRSFVFLPEIKSHRSVIIPK